MIARTWKWILLAASIPMMGGCMNACESDLAGDDDDDDFVVGECDAGDAAFVRTASLGILGRRTYGQWEVNEILAGAEGSPDQNARRSAIVNALYENEEEYVDRWAEAILDHLRVARIDDQEATSCYGVRTRGDDGGQLANHVRDNLASDNGDGNGTFSMRDLLESAIRADDLSPIYRGHLFAMMSRPIPAANVPPMEAELARRQDFGFTFDTTYLNRDLVCLGCHNSEFSVTDGSGDDDRHWPLPALLEKAVYGDSTGTDHDSAHAMFRCDDVVQDVYGGFACGANGAVAPWGWAQDCGEFAPAPGADPLTPAVANFAGIVGNDKTVYDVEAALKRGVDKLASDGLELAGDGTPEDPEAAFAYLLAMSISEMAWEEIVGSPLTIANYFPRNQAQRDELKRITDVFAQSHFSLRALVTAILGSPYINQKAPVEGCGSAAYTMPAIYDPWVLGEATEDLRKNSPGDGVAPLPPLMLTRAAHKAMNWPLAESRMFPYTFSGQESAEIVFLRGTGVFLKNGEPGFKGLDFQARLVWENRYATCSSGSPDFITDVVSAAGSATVREVAVAIKDRLVNEATIDDPSGEAAAIAALYGVASIDDPASGAADLEGSSRRLCGALLSSPQFLMSGLVDTTEGAPPSLNPGP